MSELEIALTKLVEIVARLRDPTHGCPWDLEQTHKSLTPYVIEEAYEVVEAIEHTPEDLPQELGDLLLQVLLHSQIASEANTFTLIDVIQALSDKLVKRHPHVFGELKVKDSKEVLKNWEKLKEKDKQGSILAGVPRGMPALLRAQRIGEKVSRVGFDWKDAEHVEDKITEEIKEFLGSFKASTVQEEFGDLLFSLVQWARKLNFPTEDILHRACDKFTKRFCAMEKLAGKPIQELSSAALEELWGKVKGK